MYQFKISVIIPLYNVEEFISETLESIFRQSFRDYQLILVDDGSTDDTAKIASEMIDGRSNAVLVRKENAGAAAARNCGFNVSQGEYVIFLDADDVFNARMLEEMYAAVTESKADICVCQARGFDSRSGETIRLFHTPERYQSGCFSTRDLYPGLFQIFYGHPWDKLIKRTLVERNGLSFQNLRKANDNYFVYSALLCSESIVIIDKELVDYRCESGKSIQDGISSNNLCILQAAQALNDRPDLPDGVIPSLRAWSFESFLRSFGLSAGDECLARRVYDEFEMRREDWGLRESASLAAASTLTRFKFWCYRRLTFAGLLKVYSNRSNSRYQSKLRKALLALQMLLLSLFRR